MLIDELHAHLFDGKPHLLAEPVGTWLASSRRFTAFAAEFRDKICGLNWKPLTCCSRNERSALSMNLSKVGKDAALISP
jgi:hypothetical protein